MSDFPRRPNRRFLNIDPGDDAELVALFRRLVDGYRAAYQISTKADSEFDTAIDSLRNIESEIAAIPAQGAAGLAIKACILAEREFRPGYFDLPTEPPEEFINRQVLASLAFDALRLAPEIAAMAKPMIGHREKRS